jgi:hypothetical protein
MHHIFVNLGAFTQVAIVIILVLAIGLHWRWNRRVAAAGPPLLTTFGIFFCFAGITWGLVDFDPADVRDSVPHLIQGIRTSFWASVVGIGCALTIKLRILVFGEPPLSITGAIAGATIDDLAAQLINLNRSIVGGDDSTLYGQVKSARGDSNDRLDRLNRSFERFAERMVEANSKALIHALAEVIDAFNTKLTAQFGQNFRELNHAVGKLVVWQKQYAQQLESLIEQETTTRNNMADACLQYADLVKRASAFAASAESLHALLQANSQPDRLKTSLRSAER